ncbi:extracellular solute-binding protein [Patescibacteria group bacterium]
MKKMAYLYKLGVVCLIITLGLSLAGLECPPGGGGTSEEEIVLEWWRVNYDNSKDLNDMTGEFSELYPNTQVKIRTFTLAEYEEEVVNAISASTAAENKGPDILSIHNDWLPRWQDRLLSIPESRDGSSGGGCSADETEIEHMTFREFENVFVETVVDEMSADNEIYGMPLYVDTLALFYNKDLLDSAGIPKPPADWEEFSEDVITLTTLEEGDIVQSGAAIGTSTNINRSTDILELQMLQNGTQMINDEHTKIMFNTPEINAEGEQFYPGLIATTFYTDFANAQKDVYTWNLNQDYSIDAFVASKTAMMFNYSFRTETLKTKSANLNYGVAPMPQIGSNPKVNYPNYWAEAVSNKTKYPNAAWDFVEYITDYDRSKQYLELTGRPPARRDLIAEVKDDPVLGIFAEQALSARSWWKPDNGQIEVIFARMIESINTGQSTVEDALGVAQQEAQQLIKSE